MLVYRVESFNGIGIYRCDVRAPYSDAHPNPYTDAIIKPYWCGMGSERKQFYFGFASMDQFDRWFADFFDHEFHTRQCDFLKGFAEANEKRKHDDIIGVSIYDANPDDVFHGAKQTIFVRKRAQRLSFAPFSVAFPSNKYLTPINVPELC